MRKLLAVALLLLINNTTHSSNTIIDTTKVAIRPNTSTGQFDAYTFNGTTITRSLGKRLTESVIRIYNMKKNGISYSETNTETKDFWKEKDIVATICLHFRKPPHKDTLIEEGCIEKITFEKAKTENEYSTFRKKLLTDFENNISNKNTNIHIYSRNGVTVFQIENCRLWVNKNNKKRTNKSQLLKNTILDSVFNLLNSVCNYYTCNFKPKGVDQTYRCTFIAEKCGSGLIIKNLKETSPMVCLNPKESLNFLKQAYPCVLNQFDTNGEKPCTALFYENVAKVFYPKKQKKVSSYLYFSKQESTWRNVNANEISEKIKNHFSNARIALLRTYKKNPDSKNHNYIYTFHSWPGIWKLVPTEDKKTQSDLMEIDSDMMDTSD